MPRDALLELVILLALVVLPFVLRHFAKSRRVLWLASAVLFSAGMLWLSRAVEGDSNGPGAFSLPAWMRLVEILVQPFFLLVVLILAAAACLHPILNKRELKFFYAGIGLIIVLE